jgi:hypothetical protein
MKNLLEKLKPEILNEIEKDCSRYPLAVEELKNELAKLFYVSDIRYAYIIQLDSYYLNAFYKLPYNAWENFNEN